MAHQDTAVNALLPNVTLERFVYAAVLQIYISTKLANNCVLIESGL